MFKWCTNLLGLILKEHKCLLGETANSCNGAKKALAITLQLIVPLTSVNCSLDILRLYNETQRPPRRRKRKTIEIVMMTNTQSEDTNLTTIDYTKALKHLRAPSQPRVASFSPMTDATLKINRDNRCRVHHLSARL